MRQGYGEAPGRLDFLGGVADYSGSLVLQTPIAATTRVTVAYINEPLLRVESAQQAPVNWPLDKIHEAQSAPHWSRYVLGCLFLFCEQMGWMPDSGLHFQIDSDVPTSQGVSSSAALEVATLRALENFSGLKMSGTQLAKLAQRAENEIVGAPCGLMDQLASAHGVPNALLPILCRPDILRTPIPLPGRVLVAGWPSGVQHAVSGSPYATARCATFMGKKILERHFERKLEYLTELSPSHLRGVDESILPARMSGEEFRELHGSIEDTLSTVHTEHVYPLRAAALFPVEENFRCRVVSQLLRSVTPENRVEVLGAVGELLFQSHAGYSSIGLGSPETDAMVETIRECGPQQGFYGARVSGGGAGGTVVVLLEKAGWPVLQHRAQGHRLIT